MQEAGVFKALDDLGRERVGYAHVGVASRRLVAQGYLLLHGWAMV